MKKLDYKNKTNYCQHIFLNDEFVTSILPVIKTIIATNHYDPNDIDKTT